MKARIAAKLEEQGPSGAKEPTLGDEPEGEGDSKTKFWSSAPLRSQGR